jgi:hypothetical protein
MQSPLRINNAVKMKKPRCGKRSRVSVIPLGLEPKAL